MNNLNNKLELTLTPGNTVIVYNPDQFDEICLIKCKNKRTHITLLEDLNDLDSKVMAALTDTKHPEFSIDNDILASIINRSSLITEDLISLLIYYQELTQDDINELMLKISILSEVYAPEYIMAAIRNLSEMEFEAFIETDDTLTWFKQNVQ